MVHKTAAYRYLTNSINSLPITDTNKRQELNNIAITATNNGFPTQII